MRKHRTDMLQAWVSLAWFCHEIGTTVIGVPEWVLDFSIGDTTHRKIFEREGIRFAERGAKGLSIYGLSVVACNENGGHGHDGVFNISARNSKRATWADLAQSIEAARDGVRLARAGFATFSGIVESVDLGYNEIFGSIQGHDFNIPVSPEEARALNAQLETEDADGLISEDIDILVSIRPHI